MLQRLLPLVDTWHFTDLPTPRAASAQELSALYEQALAQRPADAAPLPPRASAYRHPGPAEALQRALEAADPGGRIVVFGSFFTVGGVLEKGLPERKARHVG
jgi:dihydrofolate synthase/folylpolyglutamate synthase